MTHHHLLAVWNPTYGRDAMESHLRVLQQAVREYRAGRCKEEDVYVWWGKVRSRNRLAPIPHTEEIANLATESHRDDPGPETHVYLTDFQSLYVAHLGEVRREDPGVKSRKERERTPSYYRKDHLECDFWFRLWDIRRLVGNDLPIVAHELRKLRNTRHDLRPVSPYGGMVDLPLLITETEGKRYFDRAFRDQYAGGKFWVEFDTERTGVGEMERELRENLFGDAVWQSFGPTTRLFLATAEKLWRDHAHDPAFDCASVLLEYCKALEVRCNWILRHALDGAPPDLRFLNVNGRSVDVTDGHQLNLRELAKLIGSEREMANYLAKRLEHGPWFAGNLPSVLDELAERRGPAAHQDPLDRSVVSHWRQQLCGIGCEGHFVNLARVKVKRH